eukprot:208457_1
MGNCCDEIPNEQMRPLIIRYENKIEGVDSDRHDVAEMLICRGNSGTIGDCQYLKMLCGLLNQYPSSDLSHVDISCTNRQTLAALNCFLHLLDTHDDDDDVYEAIVHTLHCCDILSCHAYCRNTRDRTVSRLAPSNAHIDIYDKIHCYYMHSYDTGHRLTPKQRIEFEDVKDNEEDLEDVDFINKKLLRLKHILFKNKRAQFNDVVRNANNIYRGKVKCNQIIAIASKDAKHMYPIKWNNPYDPTKWYKHCTPLVGKYKMYCLGDLLAYGRLDEVGNEVVLTVFPRYECVKQELLSNDVTTVLTAEQFNLEYQKALVHLNSAHCKKKFKSLHEFDTSKSSIELVLSLMIYCNYTALQEEFSWECRAVTLSTSHVKSVTFYHLGKNLKNIIRRAGTRIRNGAVNTFYNGVRELLMFPELMAQPDNMVFIYCPLSTSSSFQVAANFAYENNGMIIEFNGGGPEKGWAKYISVSWLSDYPSEKEYLFFMADQPRLQIENIMLIENGYEYYWLLKALRMINVLITSVWVTHVHSIEIPLKVQRLMVKILHHQLSFTLYSFVSFYALSDYGKAMVQQYFAWTMGDTLYIDYLLLSQDGLKLLFEQICTRVSDLDDAVFYNILDFLLYEREISGYTRSHLWTR